MKGTTFKLSYQVISLATPVIRLEPWISSLHQTEARDTASQDYICARWGAKLESLILEAIRLINPLRPSDAYMRR